MEGAGNSNGESSGTGPGLMCVLLHPHEMAVPQDLLASLAKRIRRVTTLSDSYVAFAEMCATARDRRMFAKTPVVLVLVEPMQITDAAMIVEAARRHAPNAALWWYSAAVNPRLRAVADGDAGAWAAARRRVSNQDTLVTGLAVGGSRKSSFVSGTRRPEHANESPRVVVRHQGVPESMGGGPQRLRLVGHDRDAAAAKAAAGGKTGEDPGHRTMTPLLSEEEMRMLLEEKKQRPGNGQGQKRSES